MSKVTDVLFDPATNTYLIRGKIYPYHEVYELVEEYVMKRIPLAGRQLLEAADEKQTTARGRELIKLAIKVES